MNIKFNSKYRSILILQTWGMGDLIMMLPMLKRLNEECSAQIDIIVTNRGSYELCKLLDHVDNVFLVNLNFSSFMRTARKTLLTGYDCTILGYGSGFKQRLFAFFVAPFSKKLLVRDDKISHRVFNNLNILNHFGLCSEYKDDWKIGFRTGHRHGVLIHPGSGKIQASKKRPSLDLVKRIYFQFVDEFGPEEVKFVFGPDEIDLVEEYTFGKCVVFRSVAQAIEAISECKLLVTGDTGYGHIAALVDTTVITLAGPTDVKRTRPYNSKSITFDASSELTCIPCYGRDEFNTCPNNRCMSIISDVLVMKGAQKILSAPHCKDSTR